MTIPVTIPSVGESITEGVLARWLVAEGAWVETGTPIYELETDKISSEIQATASGALRRLVAEGETVEVGSAVAEIDPDAPRPSPAEATAPGESAEAPGRSAEPEPEEKTAAEREATAGATPRPGPAARRLIDEHSIDATAIKGSGKGGRATKQDVLEHVAGAQGKAVAPAPAPRVSAPYVPAPSSDARKESEKPAAADQGETVRTPLSPIRKRIAARLVQAQQTAAILTTFNEVDMSACMTLRQRFKERFNERHGIGLGFMSFFTKACCQALSESSGLNSQLDGDELVTYKHVHMGIAVGSERGLVVPVLRNADGMSFAEIERGIRDFAAKARDGRLGIEDMQGGTFTITNGGIYGSLMSTPILNPPQSGILGMHAIKERPIAVDGQVVIRPMMYLALSYDHRIVDGAQAVGFLVRVKELVEAPERLLLEL